MHKRRIEVSMGEGAVSQAPHVISSVGLGSCVVVTLYDARRRIGGFAHIMLPETNNFNGRHHGAYQYADTAIQRLVDELQSMGVDRRDVVAKITGGARMFTDDGESITAIGDQNIRSVLQSLESERIPLVGEDVGGQHGRSVEFRLDSGRLIVKSIEEYREI